MFQNYRHNRRESDKKCPDIKTFICDTLPNILQRSRDVCESNKKKYNPEQKIITTIIPSYCVENERSHTLCTPTIHWKTTPSYSFYLFYSVATIDISFIRAVLLPHTHARHIATDAASDLLQFCVSLPNVIHVNVHSHTQRCDVCHHTRTWIDFYRPKSILLVCVIIRFTFI